jgi:hypothetical protein
MKKEPTQKQIQKFWEWCGFSLHKGSAGFVCEKWDKDGTACFYSAEKYPPIDLNNLFRYAFSVAVKTLQDKFNYAKSYAISTIMDSWHIELGDDAPDANSLFWAIWEATQANQEGRGE